MKTATKTELLQTPQLLSPLEECLNGKDSDAAIQLRAKQLYKRQRYLRDRVAILRDRKAKRDLYKSKAIKKARDLGESHTIWPLLSKFHIHKRGIDVKARILKCLREELSPQKPIAPHGFNNTATHYNITCLTTKAESETPTPAHSPLEVLHDPPGDQESARNDSDKHTWVKSLDYKILLHMSPNWPSAVTPDRYLTMKRYEEELELWKVEYALWHARRTPENLTILIQEEFQKWSDRIRAKSKKRSSTKWCQNLDLGSDGSAEVKIKFKIGPRANGPFDWKLQCKLL